MPLLHGRIQEISNHGQERLHVYDLLCKFPMVEWHYLDLLRHLSELNLQKLVCILQ